MYVSLISQTPFATGDFVFVPLFARNNLMQAVYAYTHVAVRPLLGKALQQNKQ